MALALQPASAIYRAHKICYMCVYALLASGPALSSRTAHPTRKGGPITNAYPAGTTAAPVTCTLPARSCVASASTDIRLSVCELLIINVTNPQVTRRINHTFPKYVLQPPGAAQPAAVLLPFPPLLTFTTSPSCNGNALKHPQSEKTDAATSSFSSSRYFCPSLLDTREALPLLPGFPSPAAAAATTTLLLPAIPPRSPCSLYIF